MTDVELEALVKDTFAPGKARDVAAEALEARKLLRELVGTVRAVRLGDKSVMLTVPIRVWLDARKTLKEEP